MRRMLSLGVLLALLIGTASAALFESGTKDAQPIVLYGKTDAGVIVPVNVDSDGVINTGGGQDPSVIFNVKTEYDAVGDGIIHYDGAITSGTDDLTSATGTFTSADVGKVINVSRAGSSGGSLSTTISAYVSATEVTLAANAGATVTGASYVYGTDDTTAIQAAIDAVGTAGGGTVFFPEGIYIINGAFQDASGANAQLVLPSVDFAAPSQQIKLEGVYSAVFSAYYGAAPAGYQNNSGSILFFTKLGASGTNNIGVYNATGAWGGLGSNKFSNLLVEIENLNFRTGTNPGPSVLDLENALSMDIKNVVIEVNERPSNLIVPTITTSVALSTPGRYNHVYNVVDGLWVYGFFTGFTVNEHLDFKNGGIYFCSTGMEVRQMTSGTRGHPTHIKNISMESVKNYIFWTGGVSQIIVDILAIEEGTGIWTGTDFYDVNNYGYGTIVFNETNGDGSASVTGTTNMHIRPSTENFDFAYGGNVGLGDQTPEVKFDVNGAVKSNNTITSTRTTDLGWSIQSAADTACNTTCISACVMGVDAAASSFLACDNAAADVCLCAGAN